MEKEEEVKETEKEETVEVAMEKEEEAMEIEKAVEEATATEMEAMAATEMEAMVATEMVVTISHVKILMTSSSEEIDYVWILGCMMIKYINLIIMIQSDKK